jgi:tetratricopeptide (TPR) repeat protein
MLLTGILGFATALHCTLAAGQQVQLCGDLANHYGPYDFRRFQGPKLEIVERFHFTSKVESLAGGETAPLPGDIGYTLRAFPNHPRALIAMARWHERDAKQPKPIEPLRFKRGEDRNTRKEQLPMECWLERAVRFQPDDTVVRLLLARYLFKQGKNDAGVQHLEVALKQPETSELTHYNAGLIALDAGLYDIALRQAHRARELGLQRAELQQQLQAAGRWREPAASSPQR